MEIYQEMLALVSTDRHDKTKRFFQNLFFQKRNADSGKYKAPY
jgi:hypothetical protein